MCATRWQRAKQLLLSRWLCDAPAVPTLRVSSTCSSVVASFQYAPPTPYNQLDWFELQACRASLRGA